ncbi:MAG: UDP-glucose 4-epimerase GalE, partial [Chitinophagales bacterium]
KVTGIKLNYEIGPRRKGDVIAIYANNNLAKTKLNWEPKFSLDEMMRTAWEWEQRLKADKTIFSGIPPELN